MSDELIGVGVIGAGLWGANHANVFSTLPNTRLVAISDVDEDRAQTLATQHRVKEFYTDYRKLLSNPKISAVSIATPDFMHAPIVLDAIAADKHVLTEKPLSMNVEESKKIVHAAERSNRKVMVDFHNRVNPVFVAARQDIRGGRIGKPVHAAARQSNTLFVPLEMLKWGAQSSALWFLGSHTVDTLRYLFDDDVKRVFSMKSKGVLRSKGVDTDDVHLSILEFRSGIIATLENSWILSRDNPQVVDMRVDIVGDSGQLQLDPTHSGTYRHLGGQGTKYRDMLGGVPVGKRRIGGFVSEAIAAFIDSILDNSPVLASVHDGLRATEVLAAIERSTQTGEPVDL